MKKLMWIIFFVTIIPIFSWDQTQYEYDKNDPMKRFNRAVSTSKPNPPPPQKGQTPKNNNKNVGGQKQSVPELIKRHMALARVFNALYLQQQLSNDRIGPYDLVAGLWNLKDKTVVEKLVSLKIDGLSASLKQLETAIKTVPDDLTMIADVGKINQKLESVKGITDEQKQALVAASDIETIPVFIRGNKIRLFILEENFAEQASYELSLVKNMSSQTFYDEDTKPLRDKLEKIESLMRTLPVFVQEIEVSTVKTLDTFVAGVEAADAVKTKSADFQGLHAELIQTETRLKSLEALKSSVYPAELSELLKFLEQLHTLHSTMSIASAFVFNQDLSKFKNDFSDKWVMNVLNNGSDLQIMQKGTQFLSTFAKSFSEVNKHHKELWNLQHIYSLAVISQFFEEVHKLEEYSKQNTAMPDSECFKVPDNGNIISTADASTLVSNMKTFIEAISKLSQALSEISDTKGILATASQYRSKIHGIVDGVALEAWKVSPELVELEKFLDSLIDPFEKLKQPRDFVDAVNKLKSNRDAIMSSQTYIASLKIATEECDSVFTFNPDNLATLNGLPNSIKTLKTDTPITKLQPLLTTIPKVSAGLKNLTIGSRTTGVTLKPPSVPSKTATPKPTVPSKPKRSTDEDTEIVKNPENLLEFAFAARSIQQMELINQYDKDISTIMGADGPVSNAILKTSDDKKKQKLSNIWNGFNAFKAKLTAIQANNKLAIAKLSEQKLEKNLLDVAYVYSNLTTLKPSERAELRKYRESMVLLDPRKNDIEQAMERLEGPLATDWAMAHASFKKMPDALVELQKDFAKFFGGTGEEKTGSGNVLGVSIGGGLFLIMLIVGIVALSYWCHHYYDPKLKKKLPKEAMYMPTDEAVEKAYTYMQLQDSRLPLNKRDKKTGNTPIFDAIVARDWEKVKELIRKGAILDATNNGNKNRTALFELVLMKEVHVGRLFIQADADREVHDYKGEDCDTWGDEHGFRNLFNEDHVKHYKKDPHERYLPEVARPWNILVYDAKCFPRKLRKRLPLRIRKFITWGYKQGMDLDEFTTIIVPPRYIHGEKALILKDDNIMSWKFYGCKAVLQKVSWFHWFLAKDDISEQTKIQEDYKHWLFDTYYKEKTYENTIIQLKTGHHRMLPKLLTNVRATFLETEIPEMKAMQKEWMEIIKLFGGEINKVPRLDTQDEVLPYHIRSFDDVEVLYRANNSCWIIKYKDSKVKKSWVKDWSWCSTVDFSYVPMTLARFKIFNTFDEEFPLMAISDIDPKYMIDDLKENGEPKSVGSTTTSKVETKSVASVVSNKEGTTTKKNKGKEAPTPQEIQNRLKLPGRGPKATKSKETGAAPKSIAGVVDKPVEVEDVNLKRRRGSVEQTSVSTK